MKVLITGGSGYIGTHIIVELLKVGHKVIVYDNLSNSSKDSLKSVEKITGKPIKFIRGDVRDKEALDQVFSRHCIEGVIHLAGLKSVNESILQPIEYYENNVFGSLQLLKVMERHNVKAIVFSSSAAVYGDPKELPLDESMSLGVPTNPYGMSKLMIENILSDICAADKSWSVAKLRYFNPVGAHPSALIGENPRGVPNNLMPYITQTAAGKRSHLLVYGDDYDTLDGSGVRDYIHVVDLAKGHVAALNKLIETSEGFVVNLGTGKGYSVLQMIAAFQRVNNVPVNFKVTSRRGGDVASCYADTSLAENFLGWRANLELDDMCRDSWRWQLNNL